MPTWLTILIMVLGALTVTSDVAVYCYCKYRQTKNKPKIYYVAAAWK